MILAITLAASIAAPNTVSAAPGLWASARWAGDGDIQVMVENRTKLEAKAIGATCKVYDTGGALIDAPESYVSSLDRGEAARMMLLGSSDGFKPARFACRIKAEWPDKAAK